MLLSRLISIINKITDCLADKRGINIKFNITNFIYHGKEFYELRIS